VEDDPKKTIIQIETATSTEEVLQGDSVRLLSFLLNDVAYLFYMQEVKEAIPALPWTKVPHTPSWVVGVINLRGNIIPLIDIRALFHFEEQASSKDNKFLITDLGGSLLGLAITDVVKTVDVQKKLIEPPLITLDKNILCFVSGQTRVDDEVQLIISIRAILGSDMMKI